MKVTRLEFINTDNLLLTVLTAVGDPSRLELTVGDSPRWNDVFQYRFYFVYPNTYDCTNDNDPETMYTC